MATGNDTALWHIREAQNLIQLVKKTNEVNAETWTAVEHVVDELGKAEALLDVVPARVAELRPNGRTEVRQLEQRLEAVDCKLFERRGEFILVSADGEIGARIDAGPDALAELTRQVELEERAAADEKLARDAGQTEGAERGPLNRKFVIPEAQITEASTLAERAKVITRATIEALPAEEDAQRGAIMLRAVEDAIERVEQIIDDATVQP